MLPNRAYSAVVALTSMQLDSLRKRRARATRRLEKGVACLHATGKRPTHAIGRGRAMVAGIGTAPFGCCAMKGSCDGNFENRAPKRGQRADST